MDPLKLIRYAQGECQVWFNANESIPSPPQEKPLQEQRVLSLNNICMVDRSWTSISKFSGCGCN